MKKYFIIMVLGLCFFSASSYALTSKNGASDLDVAHSLREKFIESSFPKEKSLNLRKELKCTSYNIRTGGLNNKSERSFNFIPAPPMSTDKESTSYEMFDNQLKKNITVYSSDTNLTGVLPYFRSHNNNILFSYTFREADKGRIVFEIASNVVSDPIIESTRNGSIEHSSVVYKGFYAEFYGVCETL